MTNPLSSLRWRRLLVVLGLAVLGLYLGAASALWAYYRFHRHIPDVHWHDIALVTRFGRVRQAVGAHQLGLARERWAAKDYAQGLFLGRSALAKDAANPEARHFVASCWRAAGRGALASRILEDGLGFDRPALPLARLLAETYLEGSRYGELLALLRVRLPALGRPVPDEQQNFFRLAELRAVLESEGAEAATAVAARWPELARLPAAAPLFARIALARGDAPAGLAMLRTALASQPENPSLHDALCETTLAAGLLDEARTVAEGFVAAFPSLPAAELRLLEAHGSRAAAAREPWLLSCMRYLARFRENPAALEQLAHLAARRGWSDLAFVLYQNAVATGANARPFAFSYVGSLVAAKQYARAGAVWTDLVAQKAVTADNAPALAAMIAFGTGREGEALEQVERLRTATRDDAPRRGRFVRVLREFGFASLADALAAAGA